MLRHRCRIGLLVRNGGLAERCWQHSSHHGQRILATTPAKLAPTKAAFSTRRNQSQNATNSGKASAETPSPTNEEHRTMTTEEYERSLWEAQAEGYENRPETAQTLASALGQQDSVDSDAPQTGTGLATGNSRRLKRSERTSSLWSSLKAKLRAEESENSQDNSTSESSGSSRPRKQMKLPLRVETLRPHVIPFTPVEEGELKVPGLSYDLERVLFNPGVYQLQDTRSGVFNFDPYLADIMPVDDFDFEALKAYITSSKDVKLREMSKKYGMKYCGSTSSMTNLLAHFHYLLSAWRKPNMLSLSKSFEPESYNFTQLSRGPAAAYARLQDGVYAIDADKEYDQENILSMLGKSLEKLLTLPREEYEKYRRSRSHLLTEEERNADESYHYTTLGEFMMRSQLDAYDPRLPGTGIFDLKTRAVVTVRMDVQGYQKGQGYELRNRIGQWESFEREYYDLIRSAFLKYSLQVRMGRMDGIFLAYHNTKRIFGFQYVGLEEMDYALHGTNDRRLGDQEFKASVSLLNELLNRATKRFPGRSLRLHVETRPTKVPLTYFFVEPVTDDDVKESEEAAIRTVDNIQEKILGLDAQEAAGEPASEEKSSEEATNDERPEDLTESTESTEVQDDQADDAWAEMMVKVQEIVDDESMGVQSVREAVHGALEQSDLLRDSTEKESEQHLDSLVEALTEDAPGLREIREAAEAASQSEWTSEETGSVGRKSTTTAASEETGASSTAQQQEALKDLIVKVTQGVDDRRRELRAFERVIAKITARAKPTDAIANEKQTTTPADSERLSDQSDKDSAQVKGPGKTDTEDPGDGIKSKSEDASNENGDTQQQSHRPRGPQTQAGREIMGMYVTIRNKVNGQFVERPENIEGGDFKWAIEYTITDIPDEETRRIYPKMRRRRAQALKLEQTDAQKMWFNSFRGRLSELSKKGEKYREKLNRKQEGKSVFVAWDQKPLPPSALEHGKDGPLSYDE